MAPVSLGRCHMSASALPWTGARAPSAVPATEQLLVGLNCSMSPPKEKTAQFLQRDAAGGVTSAAPPRRRDP